MKKILLILSAVVTLSACATTEVLNVWQDSGVEEGKFSNVLVIGVLKEPRYRSLLEDTLVQQLGNLGVRASASYKMFPNIDFLDKSLVQIKIDQLKIDGIIVARLVDTRKETVYMPPATYVSGNYYRGSAYDARNTWYGYYDNSYRMSYSPDYSIDYNISTAETNIYDAKSENLVWSAVTKTAETGISNTIKSYLEVIQKKLAASKLF